MVWAYLHVNEVDPGIRSAAAAERGGAVDSTGDIYVGEGESGTILDDHQVIEKVSDPRNGASARAACVGSDHAKAGSTAEPPQRSGVFVCHEREVGSV